MVNLSNALVLAMPVIVGGFLAWLIVDYRDRIASLLEDLPARVGSPVVLFHFGANALFVLLYCLNILVAGSEMFTPSGNPLGTMLFYLIPVVLVSHIVSVSGIYLDRQFPADETEWRPSRRYYLMAVPLPLLAILFGGEYLYIRHRYE